MTSILHLISDLVLLVLRFSVDVGVKLVPSCRLITGWHLVDTRVVEIRARVWVWAVASR